MAGESHSARYQPGGQQRGQLYSREYDGLEGITLKGGGKREREEMI